MANTEILNKKEIVENRVKQISKLVEECLVSIKYISEEDLFEISWQPQYGKPFKMYGELDNDGIFNYGTRDNYRTGEWYAITQDIDEQCSISDIESIQYGKGGK